MTDLHITAMIINLKVRFHFCLIHIPEGFAELIVIGTERRLTESQLIYGI